MLDNTIKMLRSITMPIDRSMVLPKAFYFFFFAAIGTLFPYLVLYYQGLDFSGRQIGLLVGLQPVITLFSAPLWGSLADITRRHKGILILAISCNMIFILAISFTTRYFLLLILVAATAFFSAPITPLVDNTTMSLLGNRTDQYGKQRLWGSLGFGLIVPVTGLLAEHYNLKWCFYIYLMMMAFCLIISWRFPVSHAPITVKYWKGMGSLFLSRRWVLFLWIVLIGGISMTINNSFLILHLNDLGAGKSLIGLALSFSILGELPIFYFADHLLTRWGTRRMLTFAMWMYVIRNLAYSLMRAPWLALPIQMLNGPSFSVKWVAAVSYTNEISPTGMGATGQGLLGATMMGIGGTFGSLLGGFLYDAVGGATLFLWIAIGVTFGTLVFMLAGKEALQKGVA